MRTLFSLKAGGYQQVILLIMLTIILKLYPKNPQSLTILPMQVMDKKMLRQLVDYVYRHLGPKATVILSDRLKDVGYKYSTQGGLSIAIDDMIIPAAKWGYLKKGGISGVGNRSAVHRGSYYSGVRSIIRSSISGPKPLMMWPMK